MQCAKCDSPIELTSSGQAPAACPKCGAPLSGAAGKAAPGRSGGSWTGVLVFLLVGAVAVAAGSILFAKRAVDERDRAYDDLARTTGALDQVVAAAASSPRLKGQPAAEAREGILQPAIKHYQDVIAKYSDDEAMLPEVVSAKLHLAALQAKTGSAECAKTLQSGVNSLSQMIKADFTEDSYPGFQGIVLQITEPTDWVAVKTPDLQVHAITLYLALQDATSAYRDLSKKFPESVAFRDDQTALLASVASLIALIPNRAGAALPSWVEASKVLETLVRDEPANNDYKTRLAQALESAARIQKSSNREKDTAIANLKRAVEVRRQLAEGHPDDKALQQQLARVEKDLAALESQAAQSDETPTESGETQQAAKTGDDAAGAEASKAEDAPKEGEAAEDAADAGEPEKP